MTKSEARNAGFKPGKCQKCGTVFTKNSPSQRYCGSKTGKFGCSWLIHKDRMKIGKIETPPNPITQAEINDASLYEKYFKDHCVGCNEEIPATWNNYKIRGNYCMKCSVKAHHQAKLHGSAY